MFSVAAQLATEYGLFEGIRVFSKKEEFDNVNWSRRFHGYGVGVNQTDAIHKTFYN